ncbi:hypothetical protein CALVIDRAFT_195646 [Calocera viscosa TUFC12733]|uniref:Uncharacterized protein n=1 Tax=Calocera viscosa (strain TUFC12733) TaxID=1330018 RepID=A0A167KGN2_CALVF|nr:hypothetical protein CALVIDRAFT_195646 [Calocera viscosa TUFC12733]
MSLSSSHSTSRRPRSSRLSKKSYRAHHAPQYVKTPIHRLNADVLLLVFSLCRDVEPISLWTISHTSRRWRTLTLEHSFLWTNITIDHSSIQRLGVRGLWQWIHLSLSRSGNQQALDITIDLHDLRSWDSAEKPDGLDLHVVLSAVCDQAHRWRSFTYLLGDEVIYNWPRECRASYEDFETIFSYMPFLQSITLGQGHSDTNYGITPQYIHTFFQRTNAAPYLRSISLYNIDSDTGRLDWNGHFSHRTTNTPSHGLSHVLSTLRNYPSMGSLQLSGWSAGTDNEHRPVVLGQLQELTLTPNAFLSNVVALIEMPLLSELTLDSRDIPGDEVIAKQSTWERQPNSHYSTTFLEALSGERHSLLTNLVLYLPFRNVPWTSIISFSTLETIRIVKPIEDTFWLTCPSTLSALYKKNNLSGDKRGWCLPRLHTLTLEVTPPYGTTSHHAPTAVWRLCVAATKHQFMDRWEASSHSDGVIVPLAIDLIGPNWKFEIRDMSQNSDASGAAGL